MLMRVSGDGRPGVASVRKMIETFSGPADHATVAANMVDVARGRGLSAAGREDNELMQSELVAFYRLQRAGEPFDKFGRMFAGG